MRTLIYAFGLSSALVFAVAQQAAVPNFAGTWTLDKSKSQDLAPSYKSFERIHWHITQSDNEISIKEVFIGFNVKGLPPARPGTGGGDEPIGPETYNFDGSETIKKIGRAEFARKAILSNDGKTLELIEKFTTLGTDGEITRTKTDKLSLSADGTVLMVIRRKEGSPGVRDSTLVFNK